MTNEWEKALWFYFWVANLTLHHLHSTLKSDLGTAFLRRKRNNFLFLSRKRSRNVLRRDRQFLVTTMNTDSFISEKLQYKRFIRFRVNNRWVITTFDLN